MRTVRLDKILLELLKREKAKNDTARAGMGKGYHQLFIDSEGYLNTENRGQPIHMVNTRMDGTYVLERTMTYAARLVKRESGYEKFDFHSFRPRK